MNFPQIHLLLNHLPIATLLFGFCILVIGRIQRNEGVIRVALGLLVVGGFVAGASFLTGDPAADALKPYPSFSEKLIHEHKLAAGFGLWSTVITACAAAGGLYLSRKKGAVLPPRPEFFYRGSGVWLLRQSIWSGDNQTGKRLGEWRSGSAVISAGCGSNSRQAEQQTTRSAKLRVYSVPHAQSFMYTRK